MLAISTSFDICCLFGLSKRMAVLVTCGNSVLAAVALANGETVATSRLRSSSQPR